MTRQSYVRSLLELSKPYGGVIEVRASGHYRIVCGNLSAAEAVSVVKKRIGKE